jgi:predicted transcriptional regulator
MPRSTLPTDAETAILRVLWGRGPSTVREVHDALEQRDVGYTTVLKLMQIMLQKGLLARDEGQRSHVYQARVAREASEAQAVGALRERLFGGSTSQLVLRALSEAPASKAELEQIKATLEGLLAERSKSRGRERG